MGKIRIKTIGIEEVEKKEKEEAKKRKEKKMKEKPKKIKAPGGKGGERMKQIEVGAEELAKMKKAEKIIEEEKEEKVEKKPRKKKVHARGNNYKRAKRKVNKEKKYSLDEAIDLLKEIKYADFDETVELHLNVKENSIKGEVKLPHSTGKKIKVKVADDKLISQVEKGKIDFDLLIAHPSLMPKLVKVAKILGPKGLMPSRKAETLTEKPEEAAKKFTSGLVRFKAETKFPIIHQAVGKLSDKKKDLTENVRVFVEAVSQNKIKSAFIKSTMSPSIKVDLERI